MLIAGVDVQASESPVTSPEAMANDPYLWEVSSPSPSSLGSQDPHLWDISSPTATFYSSHTTTSSSFSSSPTGSCASSLSNPSPFAAILRQLVATPSPDTAAAMVQTPWSSSGQLAAAQRPCTAASRLCSPSSGQKLVANPVSSSFVPAPRDESVSGQPSSTHARSAYLQSPRFSGSPVAGLCRTRPGVCQITVRLTKKQKVRDFTCCSFAQCCVSASLSPSVHLCASICFHAVQAKYHTACFWF